MSKIVVVTLSFNRQPYTKRFLETFFKNTAEPVDMVIVDQGSHQPAKKLCKAVDGKITENGSTIKVIWNETNIGIPKALNQAMALRRRDQHYMKIDNDVIFPEGYPKWLTDMIDIAENCTEKDPIKIMGLSPFDHNRPRSERGNIRMTTLKNGHAYEIEQWPHNLLEMGLFIAADIVNKVGGFNEKGRMYGYEGSWYQGRTSCSRAYFHTYRAIHGDDCSLIESQAQRDKKNELLAGGTNGKLNIDKCSEDETPLNIKFKETTC